MRLVIPSLATPAGGLLSGIIMSRWGRLSELVRVGCLLMMVGNGLVASLRYQDSSWKYLIYLVPANFGQGMSYPAILFTFLAAFDHNGKCSPLSLRSEAEPLKSKQYRLLWCTSFVPWARCGVLLRRLH
jgi:hypothetical protein